MRRLSGNLVDTSASGKAAEAPAVLTAQVTLPPHCVVPLLAGSIEVA